MPRRVVSILFNAALMVLILAGIVLLANGRASSDVVQAVETPVSDMQPGNTCQSCHTASDPRLVNATAWQGGVELTDQSSCPAYQRIQEEIYYTERMLLMIERLNANGALDDTGQNRLIAGYEGYSRLLDAPVTSLDAFVAEAQSLRYRLGKISNQLFTSIEQQKRTRALIVGLVITLLIAGALIWGWYNTRIAPSRPKLSRLGWIGQVVLLVLVFAFFAMPLLRDPPQADTITTTEAQAIQTVLDNAERAATIADRAQGRVAMFGEVGAQLFALDLEAAAIVVEQTLSAAQEAADQSSALWGQAASAQEAAVSEALSLEKAGLVSGQLEAVRGRVWGLRQAAEAWTAVDQTTAQTLLDQALILTAHEQGLTRDLDLRLLALAYAPLDKSRAIEILKQVNAPGLRAWGERELNGEPAPIRQPEGDTPAAQTLRALLDKDFLAAWSASQDLTDPYEQAHAQAEIAVAWAKTDPVLAAGNTAAISIDVLRQRAYSGILAQGGDPALVEQLTLPYYRVQALSALGKFEEAAALAGDLKEPYPLIPVALALTGTQPEQALALVDVFSREADRAIVLTAIADQTGDSTVFERALGMALASRVRGDALNPAAASLKLALSVISDDQAKAELALQQALKITEGISPK